MSKALVEVTRASLPPMTAEDRSHPWALANRDDSEIDTSDIPEWSAEDFQRAERGRFYKPLKAQITAKLDTDVLAWLKSAGPGYHSRMNAILRREMIKPKVGGGQD